MEQKKIMDNRSLELTFEVLEQVLPEIDWLLGHMEKSKGWLNFKPEFADNIIAWELPTWSEFYLDQQKLKNLGALCFYDVDELKAISAEDAAKFTEQVKLDAIEIFGEIDDIEFPEPEEIREFLETAEDSVREQFYKQMIIGIYAFFTTTFNYLSLMTFGKTLCQLIVIAQSDDDGADKSLCQALQIDRTILHLPFVQSRILKAQLGHDQGFLEQLGNHIKRPILGKKIRYRKLWLTFAILEDEGFLDIPQEALLDKLQELGVYGREFGVEDVGHLRNRLFEYRKKSAVGQKIF